MPDKPAQGWVNHVGLVLDASGSIAGYQLTETMVQVADNLVKHLAVRSQEMDQETRVTVYTFNQLSYDRRNQNIRCVYYDKDALRLPSIKDHYQPAGQTPLVDATIKAINEMGQTAVLYGDHAFLLYVLTDGEENASFNSPAVLKILIDKMAENWTLACYVPTQMGVFEAKKYGFPPANIQIWDTTAKGLSEVGESIRHTTDAYMRARASGVRGSRNLFTLSADQIDKRRLNILSRDAYVVLQARPVSAGSQIRDFVESQGHPFVLGMVYYELIEPVEVQAHKEIALLDGGKLYVGREARDMLGLPHVGTVRVAPDHVDGDDRAIFIQSTSVNRKVKPLQRFLVMK